MAQVHVLTGPERRRRWSEEQKQALVAAAFAPGAVVSDVARQADVCSSLIYRWRREIGPPGGFAEVVVAPIVDGRGVDGGDELRCLPARPPVEAARPAAAGTPVPAIEIEFSGDSRVRIPASTPPELAAAVITALVRR